MWAFSLLAADDPLSRPEIIYGVAALVGAMLVGAIAISLTDRWRKRATAPAHDVTDVLTTYRDMYEHGEITEAEYTELRRKVAEKVKNTPAPVVPPPPDPTGRPDPAKLVVPPLFAPEVKPDPPAPPDAPPESPPAPGSP